jgi:hypothetical protein
MFRLLRFAFFVLLCVELTVSCLIGILLREYCGELDDNLGSVAVTLTSLRTILLLYESDIYFFNHRIPLRLDPGFR